MGSKSGQILEDRDLTIPKTMVFISVMSCCPWRDKFSKGLFWLILQLFPTSAKIMGNSLTVPEIGQRLQIVYVFYRFTVVANFI